MSEKPTQPRVVTTAMLAKELEAVADAVAAALKTTLSQRDERIRALEARVLELEAQRASAADISDLVL